MEIYISWKTVCAILFVAPLIYLLLWKSKGDFTAPVGRLLLLLISWGVAIGIALGKLL